jgi:hypothetical protein
LVRIGTLYQENHGNLTAFQSFDINYRSAIVGKIADVAIPHTIQLPFLESATKHA